MSTDFLRISSRTAGLFGIAAAAGLGLIALVAGGASLLEAWLLGFSLVAGLSVGALGLLMSGKLLGEVWLKPIRAELEATVSLMPMVAALAVPLLVAPAAIYPWAGDGPSFDPQSTWLDRPFFIIRSAIYLAAWVALAALAGTRRTSPVASGIGLLVLIPTVSLAALDWFASREPDWIPGLYGPAFIVSQLLAAMSFGILLNVFKPGHPSMLRQESIRSGLLTLALLTLWMWYSQFLVAWMADLPPESAWYLARSDGWLWLEAYVALPAMASAIVLLLPAEAGDARLGLASALLLVQHFAHTVWLIRPAAPQPVPLLLDGVVLLVLIGVWLIFLGLQVMRLPDLAADGQGGEA